MNAPPISGSTRVYVVLGDPISQVKAPGLLNPLFDALGVDAVLVPVHVRPAELGTVMAGLSAMANVDGVLVTVPHKPAIVQFADRCGPNARITGSANALRREPDGGWLADNFDGVGFVQGLREAGYDAAGWHVSLVGAGGAGGAIAVALAEAGAARISIHDIDRVRRDALVSRVDSRWPGVAAGVDRPEVSRVDLAVNATPLGLRDSDPLPIPPQALPPECLVADVIMEPGATRLLRTADRLGLRLHPGIHMLRSQVASYRTFFGF